MHDETLKQTHTSSPCYQTSGWAAGHFRILSKDNALPLVAFSLTKTVDKNGKEEARQYTEFDLADKLRQRGWVLPAYTMAPDARWIPFAVGMLLLHSMRLLDLVFAGLTWVPSCAGAGLCRGAMQGVLFAVSTTLLDSISAPS